MPEVTETELLEFVQGTPNKRFFGKYAEGYLCELEGLLIIHYDKMHDKQPKATEILNDETPDICASAEAGMKPEEIEEFKQKLKKEYEKALKAVV